MATELRVLILEDNALDAEVAVRELRRSGFEPKWKRVQTEREFAEQLDESLDLVLADYCLPDFTAERALELRNDRELTVPFILISGVIGDETASRMISLGATDYLLKDRLGRLGRAVAMASENRILRAQSERAWKLVCENKSKFGSLSGEVEFNSKKFESVLPEQYSSPTGKFANACPSFCQVIRQADLKSDTFYNLGRQLSAAFQPEDAAKIIVETADKLLGWDACTLDFYSPEENIITSIFNVDTIDGRRQNVPSVFHNSAPSQRMREILEYGGKLVLRPPNSTGDSGVLFGDKSRLSASLLMVPIRNLSQTIGFLSIQSYTPNAYTELDLDLLQALADYCGGALARLKIERSLRESEQRFRQITENIHQVFWMNDPETKEILYISPAFETIWSRSCESVRKNPEELLASIVPEDLPLFTPFFRNQTNARELQYRIRRPDGTIRYIRDRAFPIRDAAGKIYRMTGIAEDVTERVRSQRRTDAFCRLGQRLNKPLRMEDAAQIIIEIAEDFFGWDSCYLHLYSKKEDAVRNLVIIDLIDGKKTAIPSQISQKPTPRMKEVILKGAQLILRKAGETDLAADAVAFGSKRASASIMSVPIRNNTEILGILSIQSYTMNAYDQQDLETLQALADYCGGVFDRIDVAEKLRYQAHLLANVNDAIIATDKNQILTSWNHAAEEMYGCAASEAIGRPLQEIISMEISDAQRVELAETLEKEGRCRIELKHFRRDGKAIWVEGTTIALRDETGAVTGYASVHRDVTSRRHLEEQLRQSQKMDAFGQLAGGVAHDFNNILTVIGGYTNLLLSNELCIGELKEDLGLIAAATEKATLLTRQLLTFSRKKEMQLTSVKINDVVSNMTKMLQRIIGEDIRLQLRYSPAVPEIQADASMIEQLLLNFAVNARDAMPNGGELHIATETVTISSPCTNPEARPGQFLCLTVRDTGCGIPPEIQSRIFEPFFTTKGSKGTGLGLATVYGIVKQHRGWIELFSQAGAGTEFKIFLPAGVASRTSVPLKKTETENRRGTETILIVEDEVGVRGLAKYILQRQGYRVIEAESGVHALSVWDKHGHEIDLLLTDMVMPGGLNGRELADQLINKKPGLKIIYTSGYSVNLNEMDLKEGWNFLPKPYPPAKLTQVVRDRIDLQK